MKINTLVLTYFDSTVIKKTINCLLRNAELAITIIENKSCSTPINKSFNLNLLENKQIEDYFLMHWNISNNALDMVIEKKYEKIKNDKYILITDGDLDIESTKWLEEEINVLELHPEVFACSVLLDVSNLPVQTFPDAVNWIPPVIKEEPLYFETLTGIHFTLFRTEEFFACLRYFFRHRKPFLDANFHEYCYKIIKKKWGATKKNKALHLTWNSYSDINHPYTKMKLSKSIHNHWNHPWYSPYTHYRNENNEIVKELCIKHFVSKTIKRSTWRK